MKLVGFVNCTDGFSAQPKVVNGASDFFAEVRGRRFRKFDHRERADLIELLGGSCV